MSYNKLKNQDGITLIETVAALIIVSIILLSFIGALYQSKKTTVSAEHTMSATYIGQETLEQLYSLSKLVPFHQVKQHLQSHDNFHVISETSTSLKVTFSNIHPEYSTELSITKINHSATALPGTSELNLYTVVVNVSENGVLKNSVESIYQFQ